MKCRNSLWRALRRDAGGALVPPSMPLAWTEVQTTKCAAVSVFGSGQRTLSQPLIGAPSAQLEPRRQTAPLRAQQLAVDRAVNAGADRPDTAIAQGDVDHCP